MHENTVRRWEQLGLRVFRLPSGVHRFRRDDIEPVRAEALSGFAELTEDVPPSPSARSLA